EVGPRRQGQDDHVVVEPMPQGSIAQQALGRAVAVDAEADDIELRMAGPDERRPGRLLSHAAPGGERVAEHENAGRSGSDRAGGVATGARSYVVRLPPSVGGDRTLARGVADQRIGANDPGEVVPGDAPGGRHAPPLPRRLRRDQADWRQLVAEESSR